MKKITALLLALLLLAACGVPAGSTDTPPASLPSGTPVPTPITLSVESRLVELGPPVGDRQSLSALMGSKEVGFETWQANNPYTLLAFRAGQVVFSTWPSGTRRNDTRQIPYDEPAQVGVYTLDEPEVRLLGANEYFTAIGQRPVLTGGGMYSDLVVRLEGLTGIAANTETGTMQTLTQWQDREASSLQLSELDADRALWYFAAADECRAAFVVSADGTAEALFDTGAQPFADGFTPLACVGSEGRAVLAGRYPDQQGRVYLRVLEETGQILSETALPVPERLQERNETDIAWMYAAGDYLFVAWSSPVDTFSVLCRQEEGWTVVQHEEPPPQSILQPAAVNDRYAFFGAEDHILAVDMRENVFYRIPLPVCEEGRMLDSYVLDEQGRLLWSDRLIDGGADADGRFWMARLVPLLEQAGAAP